MEASDYSRMRTSVLVARKLLGDAAAAAELERRGSTQTAPTDDVTRMSYTALAEAVKAWRPAKGDTAETLAKRRDLAVRAYREQAARLAVVSKCGWRPSDAEFYGPEGATLPTPPWRIRRQPRCQSWQRPQGSKLYPSQADRDREALNRFALDFYKAAGVPRQER